MATEKPYPIDAVFWHTRLKGNPETPSDVVKRFRIFVDFLQNNDLVVRQLLGPGEMPDNDFIVHSNDLTPLGLLVLKKALEKWMKQISRRKEKGTANPYDTAVMEKALAELVE